MPPITFEEFAKTHPLGPSGDCGGFNHYYSASAPLGTPVGGWVNYQVYRYNGSWPAEFSAGQCDILAAMQAWIEAIPDLSPLLVVEQPLLVGDDFYVIPNWMGPTTLSHFDNVSNERYPPESPPQLANMRKAFRDALPRFTESRERLLIGILERELFPPDNCHTCFEENVPRFSVMDVATTYAEIDTWLDHEEWWVHPAAEPPSP